MVLVVFADPANEGAAKEVDVASGTRILDAAVQAGALVPTQCGGVMACLACKVIVETPAAVSRAGEKELGLLALVGGSAQTRLSCQARVHDRTAVTLLPPPNETDDDVTID